MSIMKKNCLKKRFVNADLYLMMVPAIVLLLIFAYFPMYGLTIAFKDYKPYLGIFESSWIGWRNFQNAVFTEGFVDLLKNTLILGALRLLVSFPASIAFAILLNELTIKWFKKTVQTISYLPYFVSWIIIAGISQLFLARDYGFLNHFLELFGAEPVNWYADASKWRAILTVTNVWKNLGWGSIIYLAALSNISPELYEAATVDGAGRFRQIWSICLPGIMPVICITFVLNISNLIRDDFEQIYALVGDNSMLYKTTDVIGTWIYRTMNSSFESYGQTTAVGLVQGIISLILVLGANFLVKRLGQEGIW